MLPDLGSQVPISREKGERKKGVGKEESVGKVKRKEEGDERGKEEVGSARTKERKGKSLQRKRTLP